MPRSRQSGVVFEPAVHHKVRRGIDQLVNAVRPTLGPSPRIVAIERVITQRTPEFLDNGGLIARRIVELPDRDEDTGAMYLRHLLWRLYEQFGDGTATAAVVLQAVYHGGLRYIAAGGNSMRVRKALERGAQVIVDTLAGMSQPLTGKAQIAHVAESICHDSELARMLGEIFDIISEYGYLDIRAGRGRGLEREYVEGIYWKSGLFSRQMITDQVRQRAQFENAGILISDLEIQQPRDLAPVLEAALRADLPGLMIVASKLSDSVTAMLLANLNTQGLKVSAVKTPGIEAADRMGALHDLVVLTGGRPFIRAAGDSLTSFKLEHLGRARRTWGDRDFFGIVGGRGNPRALRQHIATLRESYRTTQAPDTRKKLQERIGRLLGGSATLSVGGATPAIIEYRKEVAERTARCIRGALASGVVPGGGAALLACRPALEHLYDEAVDLDERAAYGVLIDAIEAPMRTIAENAGLHPGATVAEAYRAGPGYGLDVRSGAITSMAEAGVLDSTATLQAAIQGAIHSAALALTIDVIVHRRQRDQHTAIDP